MPALKTERQPLFIGTAGWSIPAVHQAHFPTEGSHLQRYAARFNAVEINSSFYRPHRRATYERWAATVPEYFRFAVKVPKTITHEARLLDHFEALDRFIDETDGLGAKLAVLLVQLPPSLALDTKIAAGFFTALQSRLRPYTAIACEPRHPTWFSKSAHALLKEHHVARVAADPPPAPTADDPGGWPGLIYYRLHGSPRMYYSSYEEHELVALRERLSEQAQTTPTWCIFDNTAAQAATGNALTLR